LWSYQNYEYSWAKSPMISGYETLMSFKELKRTVRYKNFAFVWLKKYSSFSDSIPVSVDELLQPVLSSNTQPEWCQIWSQTVHSAPQCVQFEQGNRSLLGATGHVPPTNFASVWLEKYSSFSDSIPVSVRGFKVIYNSRYFLNFRRYLKN
jgi:hypothetical protein